MRLKLKYMLPLWVLSFIAAAITIEAMSWEFFASLAVFGWCCYHMERHQKAYDSDLDEIFGKGE